MNSKIETSYFLKIFCISNIFPRKISIIYFYFDKYSLFFYKYSILYFEDKIIAITFYLIYKFFDYFNFIIIFDLLKKK